MSFNALPAEMVAIVCARCSSEDLAALCRVGFTGFTIILTLNDVMNVMDFSHFPLKTDSYTDKQSNNAA